MGSTIIAIPDGGEVAPHRETMKKKVEISRLGYGKINGQDMKKVIHSVKVGVALVLVSLLYLLGPLYKQVGDNAMWAIMTVVVIFEFYAGATLSKGLNRGLGTVLGGGMGCLAAAFAQGIGGIGKAIVVGFTVFIFSAAATYTRQIPTIKRKYDYGAMIFLLTFNLVVVSGLRAHQILELARDRLSTIVMGFAICIFISLLVFPIWAGDQLHDSLVSRFQELALSLRGFSKEYFENNATEKEKCGANFNSCKSILNSRTKDESLVNFARWEPWHGKFGLSYPWGNYLQIGDALRDLASTIFSLKDCLTSPTQSSDALRQSVKEPCEAIVSSLSWTLSELGECISEMRKCGAEQVILPKLKSVRVELTHILKPAPTLDNIEALGLATFIFSLTQMVEKLEDLAKHVEQLGEIGGFN